MCGFRCSMARMTRAKAKPDREKNKGGIVIAIGGEVGD